VVIPLGAVVSQLVAAMVARGDGGLDHSGLLSWFESCPAAPADSHNSTRPDVAHCTPPAGLTGGSKWLE
jgi:hypothetical protein